MKRKVSDARATRGSKGGGEERGGVRMFMGDFIVRKTDKALPKGDDVVVCFLGATIKTMRERVEYNMGLGKGRFVLERVGTNNVEREGTMPYFGNTDSYSEK